MAADVVARIERDALRSRGLPSGTPRWIGDLQARVCGTISVPGMPNYESARAGALPQYQARPAAVVSCATEQDVRMSLLAAQDQGVALRIRSGRHSAVGHSSIDGGLVIDVRQLKNVTLDCAARTATVGAGANLGEIDAALDPHMLHVPTGSSSTVGVAGFMQGGGHGWTARQFGMNCDRVSAVRVMLADGRVVRATRDVNPSLLWAICGGAGGNFGVLLDVTYDLAELYVVWGFELRWPIEAAPEVLAAMQAGFMRAGDAPDELGYKATLATIDGAPTLSLLGVFDGDREVGMELLAPLTALGTCTMTTDATDAYAALSQRLLGGEPLTEGGFAGISVAHRSGYVTRPLGIDGWAAVVEWFTSTPDADNGVVISPYGGLLARIAADDCAFVHRAVDMNVSVYAVFSSDRPQTTEDGAWEWANGLLQLLGPFRDGSVYQNLPEEGLANYRTAYWGANFPKLLAVKRLADPLDVFAHSQGVSPDPAATPPVELPQLEPEPYMTHGCSPWPTRQDGAVAAPRRDAVPRQRSPDHARLYDLVLTLQAEADWRACLDVLVRSPEWLSATTVLDLGAGNGAWGRRVAARFPMKSIVALEPDGDLHAIGAQTPSPPNFLYLNGGLESGLEGFFDVLLARGVLLHQPDRAGFARWASEHCAAALIMNHACPTVAESLWLRPKLPRVTELLSRAEGRHLADGAAQPDRDLADTPALFADAGLTLAGSTSAITELTGMRDRPLAHHLMRALAEFYDAEAVTDDLLEELFDWSHREDARLTMAATWYRFRNTRRPWPALLAT